MGWHDGAACAVADGIDWFPRTCAPTRMSQAERQNLADARRLCGSCPVRDACLADALAAGAEQPGIRAGLTERQRLDLRARRRAMGVAV